MTISKQKNHTQNFKWLNFCRIPHLLYIGTFIFIIFAKKCSIKPTLTVSGPSWRTRTRMTWMNRRRRNRKCWSLEFIRTASKTRLDGSALECRVPGEEAVKLVGVMSFKVAINTSKMP